MLDFSNKEFVRSFHWSDISCDREMETTEIVLGRTYTKHGKGTATTIVVDCWKVWDPSVKLNKFVYFGGVARQHPNDTKITLKEGLEVAEEKAFTNPDFMFTFQDLVDIDVIVSLMEVYASGVPMEMIRTSEEKNMMELEQAL